MISAPYMIGFQTEPSQGKFGGFLINPIDGHSYLAKMQQGFRGDWKFTLPYTAEPGEGAYLFSFYLFLGHLGRITHLPLLVVFHGARLLSAAWLIFVIFDMLRELYGKANLLRAGFLLAVVGSGMGWLAALAGAFTSDFWVAEAYPFLSMYTNPHFSLGMAIMIHSLLPRQQDRWLPALLSGLLLGLIQPFGVVIIGLVKVIGGAVKALGGDIKPKDLLKERWIWSVLAFCMAGGAVIAYQFWAILRDPVLSQWHGQNITARPAPLDLVVSLSPCLILSLVGLRKAWNCDAGRSLVIWGGACLALVFIPWSLQRRFLTGIFFPLAGLSVFGAQWLADRIPLQFRRWMIVVLFLAVPTNLIVLAGGLQALSEQDPAIFISRDLAESLDWINGNAEEDALVLASAEDGLYIPSLTGRRVIYGHPFETVKANLERDLLNQIYLGAPESNQYAGVLDGRGVDYVLIRADQAPGFDGWLEANWQLIFTVGKANIYTRQVP